MVKIATAIIKLIHQTIVYQIHEICKILLIIYESNHKIKAFINIETSPKDNIKKGKLSIFNIGLIVTFIIHKIIHPTKNDFQASTEFGEHSKHHKITQFSTHSLAFSQSKITIIYRISAFSIIEINILIVFIYNLNIIIIYSFILCINLSIKDNSHLVSSAR